MKNPKQTQAASPIPQSVVDGLPEFDTKRYEYFWGGKPCPSHHRDRIEVFNFAYNEWLGAFLEDEDAASLCRRKLPRQKYIFLDLLVDEKQEGDEWHYSANHWKKANSNEEFNMTLEYRRPVE